MPNADLPKVDPIDKKIIGLLFEDSRLNFADLGKELGLSKNAVWTRYNKMTKLEIIKGATVQINYRKLGYDAVGTLLLDVEPSQVEQVSSYIKSKIPGVFGPFTASARHNLRAVVALKTLSELANIKEDLRRKLSVIEINSNLWTDVWFTPENLTLIPVRKYMLEKEKGQPACPDEVDLRIIEHLAIDSRSSFGTIADKICASTDTVARRYGRLKKEGVIIPRIQIDPKKIGYEAIINYYIRIKAGYDIDEIISKLIKFPNIVYTMKCEGDYNIGTMLMAETMEELMFTGEMLSKIDGAKRTETSINRFWDDRWPIPRTYTSSV